jgi:hypothetical protein
LHAGVRWTILLIIRVGTDFPQDSVIGLSSSPAILRKILIGNAFQVSYNPLTPWQVFGSGLRIATKRYAAGRKAGGAFFRQDAHGHVTNTCQQYPRTLPDHRRRGLGGFPALVFASSPAVR